MYKKTREHRCTIALTKSAAAQATGHRRGSVGGQLVGVMISSTRNNDDSVENKIY